MSARALRFRVSRPAIVIVAVFVVSRVAAYAAGVTFDDELLHGAFQLLDVRLLHDDPFTSIFYLHSQPPLFNLLTAAFVQLPSRVLRPALWTSWALAGLATAMLLYATLRRLGVRAWLATVIVCLYVLAPETLLTESWFFYSEIAILLTAVALYTLARFATSRRTIDGVLFVSSLAALALLRSTFQLALVVLVLVIVWRQLHIELARIAIIAAVPLLLVVAWSAKNAIVFDNWSGSTWLGMNLSYIAHAGVSHTQCERLTSEHVVSGIACKTAFRGPRAYISLFPHPETYGVAATDKLYKSTGEPNFNASLYIDVASRYQHDSFELLKHGGITAFPRAELAAYTVWAEPGDDSLQLTAVRAPISTYADWFDRLVLIRPVESGRTAPGRFTASAGGFPWDDALGSVSYGILALFALALFGTVVAWRRRASDGSLVRCVCTVACFLLVASIVIGNALDYRENNRFRVEATPLLIVPAAVGIEDLVRRVRQRRPRTASTTANPVPAIPATRR